MIAQNESIFRSNKQILSIGSITLFRFGITRWTPRQSSLDPSRTSGRDACRGKGFHFLYSDKKLNYLCRKIVHFQIVLGINARENTLRQVKILFVKQNLFYPLLICIHANAQANVSSDTFQFNGRAIMQVEQYQLLINIS